MLVNKAINLSFFLRHGSFKETRAAVEAIYPEPIDPIEAEPIAEAQSADSVDRVKVAGAKQVKAEARKQLFIASYICGGY